MARQEGIIPLRGTIGNITFIKRKDGTYLAQSKTSVDKQRIHNDPSFQRTRENNREFRNAATAASLLRAAARLLLQNVKDNTIQYRLFTIMMSVLKADSTSARGERNVTNGMAELLEGFDCNRNASLKTTLYKNYTATINRVTGDLNVNVPALVPYQHVVAPEGTTHFCIVSGGYEIDFANGTYINHESSSAVMPLDTTPMAPLTLTHNMTANSTLPLFVLLGIQFFQEVNGVKYPLLDGQFSALSIVKVEGV